MSCGTQSSAKVALRVSTTLVRLTGVAPFWVACNVPLISKILLVQTVLMSTHRGSSVVVAAFGKAMARSAFAQSGQSGLALVRPSHIPASDKTVH